MSEAGLHPLEMILRLCAAVAPEPWYPRLFAKQEGVDRRALSQCLEELWLSGLIERAAGTPETGPAITLTREGQRVLLDPEALERLRSGKPVSAEDRGAVIRGALRGRLRPVVNRVLLALNILIFVAGYYSASKVGADSAFLRGSPLTEKVAAILEQSGALTPEQVVEGKWWRLLTAGFVHIGFLHLLMNMTCLFVAGRFIEQMWGHVRYLVIYLVALIGGSCLGIAHTPVNLLAGASGAICGILAAEAVWFLFNRRYLPSALFRQARTNFIINLVLLIFISSFPNVSGWGHFGGAVAGALTAMLLQLHRFGPPVWRWLAILGFMPMVWYGHHAIEHARANDLKWFAVEDREFEDRQLPPVLKGMKKAREVYFKKVDPVLETHPTRRDADKVEALMPIIEEQKRELTSLAEGLARAGPYHSSEAEKARQVGEELVRATIKLFNQAEHLLQVGENRTDKDRRALREQDERVKELRNEWNKLFERP